MTNAKDDGDWRKLCELAAKESDPAKLYALVARLNRALEARTRSMQGHTPDDGSSDGNVRSINPDSR